jgi:hypothetical protein
MVSVTASAQVQLPTATCGLTATSTCLVFQDFTVYSLPLLQEYQNPSGTTPDYPLTSSLQGLQLIAQPNQALVDIISTNAQGTNVQGKNTAIDDPYDARTGAGNDNLQMLMLSASFGGAFLAPSDPAGGPTADNLRQSLSTVVNATTFKTTQADLLNYSGGGGPAPDADCNNTGATSLNGCLPQWDASVPALRTALGTGDLVFFFVNNETGDSGELLGQDLLGWLQVCLTDTAAVNPAQTMCFTFGGQTVNGVPGPSIGFGDTQIAGLTDILPTTNDVWGHVHSDICVSDGTTPGSGLGVVYPGACGSPVPGFPNGVNGKTIDQSLGQNEGTFALFNAVLNALVKDPNSPYDVMTVDGRIAFANNGGDLLWIGAANVVQTPAPVPVPGTVALLGLGLGLLSLVGLRRRGVTAS